jgi:glyoxylase-like metal-dependent hydrolase (beta-lactamase superfamily II)
MSAEVKILVKGSVDADRVGESGIERDCPTITLVRDGKIVMVVDPGVLASQQILIDALKKENLTIQDVNFVCVTHSHLDHYRNVGMFPDAKVLEFFGLWSGDIVEEWIEDFTPNIQVLRTPGHDYTSISLLVKTKEGVVAICGDVFWKEDHPHNPHDDPYASDPVKLEESRELIIKKSQWIIPGHGGMYNSDVESIFIADTPHKDFGGETIIKCKKCSKEMQKGDRCRCRPYLCIKHCECGFDCQACGCSHKIYQK